MKLFSWAQKKLHASTNRHKHQYNADRLFGINGCSVTAPASSLDAHAPASGIDTHAEVLTIGTLGLGSLLSATNAEDKKDEDEDEEEEDNEHCAHTASSSLSPHRQSTSSHRASCASISSHRISISSNRESVSSVDMQKLQEELQKILYFKVGDAGSRKSKEAASEERTEGKAKKKGRGRNIVSLEQVSVNGGERKLSHVPMRGVLLPLHNFLEMPMDSMSKPSPRPPLKTQYVLLMQSLKSKLLHYTSPTRVKIPPSLFDKLKLKGDLQHGSTMDKMLHMLRKIMHKRPHGMSKNGQEERIYEEDKPKCIDEQEQEEEDEERLKWAVAKSYRGSERFINYITSTLAQVEKDQNSHVHDQHELHNYQHQIEGKEGGSKQLMFATSTSLDNECWIKTDDEYLVLEL